jgi:hypothetical protein
MKRNAAVEKTVANLLATLDRYIGGGSVSRVIPPRVQVVFDESVANQKGSVRLASAFFVVYALVDRRWGRNKIPIGIRGEHGDKRLSAELTTRHVTFHRNITAFGENLGTKGNVRLFRLSTDPRFKKLFAGLKTLSEKEHALLAEHVVWRLFESRVIPKALPALPAKYLTYARALMLAETLLGVPSEGHIQQFLVASFLWVHRKRFGHSIETHHPHASDKFDGTVGDVEELRDGVVVAAYEVTVRDDWKNRLPDFIKKMRAGKLSKYVIFASGVRGDALLSPAASLVSFTANLPMDLAVVDIRDFFAVFCAELSQAELVEAFNKAYEFLMTPKLCGRADFMEVYRAAVDEWLADDPAQRV